MSCVGCKNSSLGTCGRGELGKQRLVFALAGGALPATDGGLRRRETRMLDVADFGANPHAAEFGEFGLCRVRFGKASTGCPPKPRTVLTVWDWTPEVLERWSG